MPYNTNQEELIANIERLLAKNEAAQPDDRETLGLLLSPFTGSHPILDVEDCIKAVNELLIYFILNDNLGAFGNADTAGLALATLLTFLHSLQKVAKDNDYLHAICDLHLAKLLIYQHPYTANALYSAYGPMEAISTAERQSFHPIK